MRDRRGRRLAGLGVGLALLLAGCGSDDGAGVRNVDGTQSPSGSGTASGRRRPGGYSVEELSQALVEEARRAQP